MSNFEPSPNSELPIEEQVILVNEQDEVVGFAPKLKAHEEGTLHRAVSVCIFNSKGEWLLQRRAPNKYHSAGLWTNTACTHPYHQERNEVAACRRLKQEMGLDCDLTWRFSFIYKADLDNQLIEHELDHVFTGTTDQLPKVNLEEADAYRYASVEQIHNEIATNPENYTEWFKLLFKQMSNLLDR